MPRISNQNRAIAIGLLEAGTPVKQVARRMGVSPNAIRKLRQKFMETGQVKDRPQSGRPKVTTRREDRLIIKGPFIIYTLGGVGKMEGGVM
jgi:transposase-like protein